MEIDRGNGYCFYIILCVLFGARLFRPLEGGIRLRCCAIAQGNTRSCRPIAAGDTGSRLDDLPVREHALRIR